MPVLSRPNDNTHSRAPTMTTREDVSEMCKGAAAHDAIQGRIAELEVKQRLVDDNTFNHRVNTLLRKSSHTMPTPSDHLFFDVNRTQALTYNADGVQPCSPGWLNQTPSLFINSNQQQHGELNDDTYIMQNSSSLALIESGSDECTGSGSRTLNNNEDVALVPIGPTMWNMDGQAIPVHSPIQSPGYNTVPYDLLLPGPNLIPQTRTSELRYDTQGDSSSNAIMKRRRAIERKSREKRGEAGQRVRGILAQRGIKKRCEADCINALADLCEALIAENTTLKNFNYNAIN